LASASLPPPQSGSGRTRALGPPAHRALFPVQASVAQARSAARGSPGEHARTTFGQGRVAERESLSRHTADWLSAKSPFHKHPQGRRLRERSAWTQFVARIVVRTPSASAGKATLPRTPAVSAKSDHAVAQRLSEATVSVCGRPVVAALARAGGAQQTIRGRIANGENSQATAESGSFTTGLARNLVERRVQLVDAERALDPGRDRPVLVDHEEPGLGLQVVGAHLGP
jgi:hypothetical protein